MTHHTKLRIGDLRLHGKPLAEQVFHCQGCGAEYILPPGRLSLICAYCGEAHVISVKKEARLLAPEGILPHAYDQTHAGELLAAWLEALKIRPARPVQRPRGLYVLTDGESTLESVR